MIILPALFLATPAMSVPPAGSVDGWLGSADVGCVIVDDSITGADVCCCYCGWWLLPAQVVIPESIMAGSYRMSRDHVSYVTRSRVNRHVLSYQKVRARQCHLQQPEAPPRPSPRGGSLYLLCLRAFEWRSFPLGKAGMGPLCWLVRTPGNSDGVAAAYGWHLPGPLQG